MNSLIELMPVFLLLAGGIPFFAESRASLRNILLGMALFLGVSVLINLASPRILLSNPAILVSFTFLSFAIITWRDRARLLSERTSGLLFLHSITFLYGVSLHAGVASSFFGLSLLGCAAVGLAAFTRISQRLPFRIAITLWSTIVLAGISIWQIKNALAPDGLASLAWLPHAELEPLTSSQPQLFSQLLTHSAIILSLCRDGCKLVLFGGSFAFLLISVLTATRRVWTGLLEWAALQTSARHAANITSIGVAPSNDRRFPLPGIFAVLTLHALPLLILRIFFPQTSEAWVLNLSLAASPLLILGLLRRTGWSGLREVPLQDETMLGRMKRSSLHRDHPRSRAS